MPTLSEQLDTSLGGIDISLTVDGEAQKLVTIGTTLAKLIDDPPGELADYLTAFSEFELPKLGVTTDLDAAFSAMQELIPADIGELSGGVLGSLDELEATALAGIDEVIQPALDAINGLLTLFRGDPTCGLIPGFMGAPAASAAPAEDLPPVLPPPPAGGEPNPGPVDPVVSRDEVDAARARIDLLPSPLTIATLLPWLSNFWGNHELPYNMLRAVPIIDDLRSPLATLTRWQTMSGDDIIDQFALTVDQIVAVTRQNSSGCVDLAAGALNTALAPLDTTALGTAADTLASRCRAIGLAIGGGDLSGSAADLAAIDAAIGELQAQHAIWTTAVSAPLAVELTRHGQFPDTLEEHIVRLISLLQPRPAVRDIFAGKPPALLDDSGADLPAVELLFDEVRTLLDSVLDAIDLAVVFEPVSGSFEQASALVADINQQLVGLTLEIKTRLTGLEEAIDGIDLSSLQTGVRQALEDFSDKLQGELNSGFTPVRNAFETVMNQLVTAVNGFDPAALQGEIENVINTITGVFASPEVQGAIAQLGQLTSVADSIDSISFTPLTDGVIAGIDEVKSALDAIDESTLDPPLPQMLDTAMAMLPRTIEPLTEPLVERLGDLIAAGPIELIDQIKEVPGRLFDQVRQYDPETLLGERLAGPYEDLLQAAGEFSPQAFVDQIESEFEDLRERVKKAVSPGKALQPIVDLHRQLAGELAAMNPGDLVEPLDAKIRTVTTALSDTLDLDAVLGPLSRVVEAVNQQVDLVKKGIELVQHLLTRFDDLADAPAQIQAWIDDIFAKIPDGIDASSLAVPLADLAGALGDTRAAGLEARVAAQFAQLDSQLAELEAGRRLADLVQAVTTLPRNALSDLPDSAEKAQLLGLLDKLDVTDQQISGALQQLATLTEVRAEVRAGLTLKFSDWDERYHRPGGTLDELQQPGIDMARIKLWLREAIDRQVAWPLEAVLGKVAVLQNILGGLIAMLSELTSQIDAKMSTLLSAPQAVIDLGDTVQQLLDDIAAINLDFLQDSINAVFDRVRGKFNDLNPAALQVTLDEEFDDIIDGIDFDLIVPPDSFDSLEDAFEDMLRDLEALNPRTLLVEPLQELFDDTVQPVIASLDVTPLLQAVVDRLRPLEDELRSELKRVDTAYQAMLAAAPDTSISVGVSVGF